MIETVVIALLVFGLLVNVAVMASNMTETKMIRETLQAQERTGAVLQRWERLLRRRAAEIEAAARLVNPLAPGGIMEMIARYSGPNAEVHVILDDSMPDGPVQ